jgi:excisionase family DNA binding protein
MGTRHGPVIPASKTPDGTGLEVRFWKVAEAATFMQTSKMTVYRPIHSGELEWVHVGRGFRILEPALSRYLANGTAIPLDTP